MATILFTSAGRVDLPWFWAVILIHASMLSGGMFVIDAGLREERLRPGQGGPSHRFRMLAIPIILAHLVVAGLDVGRFEWSGPISVVVRSGALAGYVAAMGLSIWAMYSNRYFSPTVRIQTERGHHVISSGPYRHLRHPGYFGVIFGAICGGVALGSLWSLVPLIPLVGLFLWRTAMEDRFLLENLEGYTSYASRVRFRLVPGLW
ncbi:methyltransferase family protein [Tundrisphaera lichenicola]|uniref:methyltransferase family protein n=1 Tax=Tundrisphaera lichenicola TaxID=2029860 RepID=UPI003EBC04BD